MDCLKLKNFYFVIKDYYTVCIYSREVQSTRSDTDSTGYWFILGDNYLRIACY